MKPLAENVHLTPLGDALEIVDQTLLPTEKRLITLKTREELYRAIYTLQVRGAPAIGIFAGYALYVLAQQIDASDFPEFYRQLSQDAGYLEESRPVRDPEKAAQKAYEKGLADGKRSKWWNRRKKE